jgi:DNA-binding PadR family transcriptional regulator
MKRTKERTIERDVVDDIKEDLKTWLADNFEAIDDTISEITSKYEKKENWDDVEVDNMVDEISVNLEENLRNVIDTYEYRKEG